MEEFLDTLRDIEDGALEWAVEGFAFFGSEKFIQDLVATNGEAPSAGGYTGQEEGFVGL
jgi:hypothetical protein